MIASVIIPTQNRPEAIRMCLDALALQALSPGTFEVIVVDDGSTRPLSIDPAAWAHAFPLTLIRQENTMGAETSQFILDLVYEHFNRGEESYFFASNNIACQREAYWECGGFDAGFPWAAAEAPLPQRKSGGMTLPGEGLRRRARAAVGDFTAQTATGSARRERKGDAAHFTDYALPDPVQFVFSLRMIDMIQPA